jgi:plastocyanin
MRMLRQSRVALLFAGLAPASLALAAGLDVTLTDAHGAPVADAVVTLLRSDGAGATEALPPSGPATKTIDQRQLTFVPLLQIFRPGDRVVFRNSDETRHHVYSFSPIKAFEFMLAAGESSAPLELERSGVIAVGCNIHDPMIAYLYVSDAQWIARSGSDGQVAFRDLPAGVYSVNAWQPRLRPGQPGPSQSTTLVGTVDIAKVAFVLPLLPESRRQFDRESTRY